MLQQEVGILLLFQFFFDLSRASTARHEMVRYVCIVACHLISRNQFVVVLMLKDRNTTLVVTYRPKFPLYDKRIDGRSADQRNECTQGLEIQSQIHSWNRFPSYLGCKVEPAGL